MVCIPRGSCCIADGTFISDVSKRALDFDTDDTTLSKFGITDHPLKNAEASVRQRNYHQ